MACIAIRYLALDLHGRERRPRLSACQALVRHDLPDEPPQAHFLVDITSLRRMNASDPVMTAQLRHLLAAAELPNLTVQVVPECWHPGVLGGFIVADNAAYVESLIAGQVYAEAETVSALSRRFATIASEAMRASESLALIREMLAREQLAKVKLLKRQWRRLP